MRILSYRRREEGRGLDAVLPPAGQVVFRTAIISPGKATSAMKIIGAVVSASLVLLPVRWQPGMTATNGAKTETVVDASGNLRVPGDYRTAYQFLGSGAVQPTKAGMQSRSTWSTRRPARSLRTVRTGVSQMALCR